MGPIYMATDRVDTFFRLLGDKTGNGEVAFDDFIAMIASFGSVAGNANYDDDFDFDTSNSIVFSDFMSFIANFGKSVP